MEAEMAYRRAIQGAPGSLPAHLGLARSRAASGFASEAVADLLTLTRRWMEADRLEEATALADQAVDLAPVDGDAHALLGRLLARQRRYLRAEMVLARATELNVDDPEVWVRYGAVLWENGRLSEAEAALGRAVSLSGRGLAATYQLGRLLLWQSRFDDAVPLLLRGAELAPDAADVRLDLARAFDGAGRSAEAVDAFRRAAELAPEHSELRYGLAMALHRNGDAEAAQSELETYRELYEAEQAATRRGGLSDARLARGAELVRVGRTEEAVDHLRRMPQTADVLALLARALRASGDLENALRELARAVALEPDRADLRATLDELRLEELRRR